MFIYLVHNTVNGKYYVGKTEQTLAERWRKHVLAASKASPYHLHRAIRKYGVEQFQISQLMKLTDKTELNRWEIELISLFKANDPMYGYNMTRGGDGVGKPHTKESREKMSKSHKGVPLSPEHRAALTEANQQAWKRPEAKERARKRADKVRGQKRSPEQCNNISNSLKGRQLSQETKHKIRVARKQQVFSEEAIQKRCVGLKAAWARRKQEGRAAVSDETRKKMSEARKGKVPWNKGMKKAGN